MSTIINASSAGLSESVDTSGVLQLQTANTAALTISTTKDVFCNSTGAVVLASGTTAQRPASPVNGMIRYNTTLGQIEGYANSTWQVITVISSPTYTASYLVVGAGGGGGSFGGGGGAGGFLTGNTSIYRGIVYPVIVGAGGTGATTSDIGITGNNGNPSSVFQFTTYGGGGGGTRYGGTATPAYRGNPGNDGGSGGGGGQSNSGTAAGGSAKASQGNAGGAGKSGTAGVPNHAGGGGGGAGGAGGVGGATTTGGTGGVGALSNITGSTVFYAGGGGGCVYNDGTVGIGGNGGGGSGGGNLTGGTANTPAATAGTANTGGGGGGGSYGGVGGSGGSGIVIISIPTTNYTGTTTGGPTVTTVGNNTVLIFTASGSYTA